MPMLQDNYGAHMGGPSHVGSPVNGAPEANIPRAGPPDAGGFLLYFYVLCKRPNKIVSLSK